MTDRNAEFSRVTFDLPRHNVPELMAYLGSFAADHNLAINVENVAEDVSEPGLFIEDSIFNPSLVTFLPKGEAETAIPVVTRANLDDFAVKTGRSKGFGVIIVNALSMKARKDPVVRAMLYGREDPDGYFTAMGIRAEHVKNLAYMLDSSDLRIEKIGSRCITMLDEYAEQLLSQ